MRVILKGGMLILAVEDEAEATAFAKWRTDHAGHVFFFDGGSEKGGSLQDLGVKADACREPINIVFGMGDPQWQPVNERVIPGNGRDVTAIAERPVHVNAIEPPRKQGEMPPVVITPGMTMAEIEKTAITSALAATKGNRRKAAEMLGIGERTMYRKLRDYGIPAR